VKEPPWLEPPALEVVGLILRSHRIAYGTPLMAGGNPRSNPRLRGQELFAMDMAVLAHDGTADPKLTYANAAALRLWGRTWAEMIGLPSRLTAEPDQQRERAEALRQAQQQGAISCYSGTRVDATARRFRIVNARVWSIGDGEGSKGGQAACFANWWWLDPT
jgi:PAS domain-containing protein